MIKSPLSKALARVYDAAAAVPAEAPASLTALANKNLKISKGIEVGHIFYFGTKYSAAMGATVSGPDGQNMPVHMGSYGIGVSRLVGGIIEASHDDKGIIWPDSVAPFDVAIVNLKPGDAACDSVCAELYQVCIKAGMDPLIDDRDERPGAKLAAMDLLGIPWQVVVGPRGLHTGCLLYTSDAADE